MLSVIIRNLNESQYIGFALQSICDHIPGAEVIIVDNNSTDDSLDVVRLFNNRLNINIITISDYTPGRSLNKAVRLCTNDIILIMSAHSQITKMDLEYIQTKLKKYSAVFGNQIPIYRGKKITKRYIWSHFVCNKEIDNMHSTIEDRSFLHNAFCFYNKRDLIESPFDESLSGKEDRYWAADVLSKGKSYLYTPKIEINHYYTINGATWKGLG